MESCVWPNSHWQLLWFFKISRRNTWQFRVAGQSKQPLRLPLFWQFCHIVVYRSRITSKQANESQVILRNSFVFSKKSYAFQKIHYCIYLAEVKDERNHSNIHSNSGSWQGSCCFKEAIDMHLPPKNHYCVLRLSSRLTRLPSSVTARGLKWAEQSKH